MIDDFKHVVLDICAISAEKGVTLFQDHPHAARLCYTLEKILSHGLRDTAVFGKTYFWNYVKNLNVCLPSTSSTLESIRDMTSSTCGRGRLFLRMALNERALADYMSALVWNASLTEKHYKPFALLQREEDASIFLLLLENLNKVEFSLATPDPALDNPEYWTNLSLQPASHISRQNESMRRGVRLGESGESQSEEGASKGKGKETF
tara:strand:+ start:254 stop:874 length:621 start_codon:yes stop_codon:yes gene_type:complete